jgi:hypothetical protein
MDKSMFSEEYWNDICQAIREDINEEGNSDNIMSIKEDLDRRCVVISLYVGMIGDDEEETEYYKRLLSSFKSSMSTWELNPFKKYEFDGCDTFTLYVKAESTIKKYEKEYDEDRPSDEEKRQSDIAYYSRSLKSWEGDLEKYKKFLDSELNVVEKSKAELEELKAKPREKKNKDYLKRLQEIKFLEKQIEYGVDESEVKELKKKIKNCEGNIKICKGHLKELGVKL